MSAKAELAELREHFDQRVSERVELILAANLIRPDILIESTDTDAQIRAKVVAAEHGVQWIDGMNDDEILGCFRVMATRKPLDPVRLALVSRQDRRH